MSGGNSSLGLNEPAATIFAERTIIVEEIFNGCGWGECIHSSYLFRIRAALLGVRVGEVN